MNKKVVIGIILACLIIICGLFVNNRLYQNKLEREQRVKEQERQKEERRVEFKKALESFIESASIQASLDRMNYPESEIDRCYVFSPSSKDQEHYLKTFSHDKYEGSAHVICKDVCYLEIWLKNEEFYVDKLLSKGTLKNAQIKDLDNNPSFDAVSCNHASSYDELIKIQDYNIMVEE